MDANTIIQIVSSLGFPIVMCGAMGYYVKYSTDKFDKERERTGEEHKVEMDRITEALNNNTIALTKLCERMESNGK